MRTTYLIACLTLALLALFGLSGCSNLTGEGNRTVSAAPEDMKKAREAQIERIKNDPNMPPQVKEQAISQLMTDRSGQTAKPPAK